MCTDYRVLGYLLSNALYNVSIDLIKVGKIFDGRRKIIKKKLQNHYFSNASDIEFFPFGIFIPEHSGQNDNGLAGSGKNSYLVGLLLAILRSVQCNFRAVNWSLVCAAAMWPMVSNEWVEHRSYSFVVEVEKQAYCSHSHTQTHALWYSTVHCSLSEYSVSKWAWVMVSERIQWVPPNWAWPEPGMFWDWHSKLANFQISCIWKIMMFGMSQAVQHQNGILVTLEFLPKPARPLSINTECSGWTFQIGTFLNQLHLKNNDVWYVASRTTSKRNFDYMRVLSETC